ncbi:unnamed protein product [Medioppia subpectinata]|uniref:Uncharacterized protein n=1 Tax=Medioppia subpectinata TaxID=1979941 RepID=A0A7R9KHT6_9ACAR|nr:unnamed protein product [Medioppia subpectinata]CAG2103489.1 unnamed protein product [Medioppia subpectinata]
MAYSIGSADEDIHRRDRQEKEEVLGMSSSDGQQRLPKTATASAAAKEASGRRLRALQKRRYTEEYADEEDFDFDFAGRAFDVDEKLVSDKFDASRYDFVREMTGDQFTIAYIQHNGFEKPIVIKQMKGMSRQLCLSFSRGYHGY